MSLLAKIIDAWDRASETYDAHVGHGLNSERERALWTEALQGLLPPPPADILDVGTGTGAIALLLAELGYSVRGIDLSEKMLGRAREKALQNGGNVRFDVGDAMAPPGAPRSVDVVFSRHLIHMLPEPGRALANWLTLLRPGGRVVIVDGMWGQDADDRVDHEVQAALPLRAPDATVEDVRRLVETAGFVDARVSDLAEVDRIERELATPEDPAPRVPHYVVTGRKPE